MAEFYRSPHGIEEDIKNYRRNRFEILMTEVDEGKITREEALGKMSVELVIEDWLDEE